MTISKLTHYQKMSPNCNKPRNHVIDTITIHCTAGLSTLQSLGEQFGAGKGKSANYAVDNNGLIGCYVAEENRSWCSSSRENDNRAITIEVATESKPPYKCSAAALDGLVQLLVDICQRNGIDSLRWQNNKTLIGKTSEQNVTVHRWFASTDCPGEYLLTMLPTICKQVNDLLHTGQIVDPQPLYRVQIGAFRESANAEECMRKARAAGFLDAFITYG